MDKPTITIYDVAREAGVSMATVSRVVNGNANVKPATKEKVEKVIAELGYRPNAVARGLASRKTTTVGLIIPDLTDQYFAELARGIEDVANMYNYQIILSSSNGSEIKNDLIDNLLGKQVDGIIFMGNQVSSEIEERLLSIDLPVVLTGALDTQKKLPSVNIDYFNAFRDATLHLIENDHRRIAFISGPLSKYTKQDYKFQGYEDAIAQHGINHDDKLIFQAGYTYEAGYQLAQAVKTSGATAAVITTDEMAAGVLNGLTDLGLHLPQDFELIASNNSQLTRMTRPAMSSITQPIYDMGAVSMRMLTKLMGHEELDDTQIELMHGFTTRDSTAK
ncbi:catabolite control protein A [Weissella viridescens]|uniref:catabolite control protein A n=1 Tax=Weissella viridescens TaxID=1629 RepID=UPI001D07D8E6|nr:catabolite control protein A [Weissella viridescens]MCB6840451.1 catabolite control protein A [Weissella viridescens]MCB6847184.1 catabolite control protein A [Weissella viridescens]